jgi:HTH-type transcriptional regulator / antitoxin HigA
MPEPEPSEFSPEWALHPGVLLRSMLEARSIRQAELAERTGLSAKHVNQIVNELIGVSADVALLLDRALGTNAGFWTEAEAAYQAWASRQKAQAELPALLDWARGFDPFTLNRTGITSSNDNDETRVEKILRFFGVSSPDAFDRTWIQPRVSFRRSQSFTVDGPNTALWLRLLDRSAEHTDVAPLRLAALRKVARTVPAMTNHTVPHGFAVARSALAEAGVVLTFVREVPNTRVCGATWWVGPEHPVIGLTERHRKPDIFWFNLLHEIGHILLHPRRQTFVDLETDKKSSDSAEAEAHEFAETTMLSSEARSAIDAATSRDQLLRLATRFGVGLPIVAGRHGHATGKWSIGAPFRGTITEQDIEELELISGTGQSVGDSSPAINSEVPDKGINT